MMSIFVNMFIIAKQEKHANKRKSRLEVLRLTAGPLYQTSFRSLVYRRERAALFFRAGFLFLAAITTSCKVFFGFFVGVRWHAWCSFSQGHAPHTSHLQLTLFQILWFLSTLFFM